ncbi:hypothetical protein [Kitasatospora brasiliensis]|uniref:hypothetical protein n=1 Tax=Kitasatospora brasiliensis TaxID=3058040 RepID=UPI00292D0AD8|nr:hypothetical protein [Kitasatospora sp. K002]
MPVFERALQRLGFEAQLPERATGNGPDVLWVIGELKYLVLAAKSGATSDKIWRSDVAQPAHSMSWFQQTYDQTCTATPVLLRVMTSCLRSFRHTAGPHGILMCRKVPVFPGGSGEPTSAS